MVLTEAWARRRPVLVNGRCAVLREQVNRSGGGLAYHGFAELETMIEELLVDPGAVSRMGTWGRSYLEQNYTWDRVLDRYEAQLHLALSRPGARSGTR
jgi:glycosyltransferase involved in cell wall biosynthesis